MELAKNDLFFNFFLKKEKMGHESTLITSLYFFTLIRFAQLGTRVEVEVGLGVLPGSRGPGAAIIGGKQNDAFRDRGRVSGQWCGRAGGECGGVDVQMAGAVCASVALEIRRRDKSGKEAKLEEEVSVFLL